jgi:CBS domain-containing protein
MATRSTDSINKEVPMRVADAMTRNVRLAEPDQPIREAAKVMAAIDAGLLPVAENDRLIGMISDRDIAVRAVAQGKGPDTPVREVMTRDVKYCFDDEDTDQVARNMGDQQIRRLPVVNREKRLVGILSLGDLTSVAESGTVAEGLAGISRPGGAHSQKGASQSPNA